MDEAVFFCVKTFLTLFQKIFVVSTESKTKRMRKKKFGFDCEWKLFHGNRKKEESEKKYYKDRFRKL